jgi:hypothetical protein
VSGLVGAVVVLMGLVRHCSSEQIDNFVEEAEGIERTTTALPGRQLELLKASLGRTHTLSARLLWQRFPALVRNVIG